MLTTAMAVADASGRLEVCQIELGPLAPNEVMIEVSHCGVCRGDLRLFKGHGHSSTPAVPGHEVIGHVIEVGLRVDRLKIGDRVGVGWQSGACGECVWCARSEPELCPTQEETCIHRPGGYAKFVKAQEAFAVRIPKELDSSHAAPLLCGGLAVFSPLLRHKVPAKSRVGIVGIGGLGHLTLQLSRAFGYQTVAMSSSMEKAADAKSLGADEFVHMQDFSSLKTMNSSLDLILTTSSGALDWSQLVRALRPGGTVVAVGVSSSDIQLPVSALIDERKTITGNPIGSPQTLGTLLDFCVRHEVRPWTEPFKMSQASSALVRLRDGQIRYRAILEQDL